MKKMTVILLLLSILVLTTSFAASDKVRIGERVVCSGAEIEFPAGAPFHIAHGWAQLPNEEPLGLFRFTLDVDGVQVKRDFLEKIDQDDPGDSIWFWVYNFPEGMTGTHTFSCHWYGPCFLSGETCIKKNQIVEYATNELTVIFTP